MTSHEINFSYFENITIDPRLKNNIENDYKRMELARIKNNNIIDQEKQCFKCRKSFKKSELIKMYWKNTHAMACQKCYNLYLNFKYKNGRI